MLVFMHVHPMLSSPKIWYIHPKKWYVNHLCHPCQGFPSIFRGFRCHNYILDLCVSLPILAAETHQPLGQVSTSFCERRMMAVGSTGISDTRRPRGLRRIFNRSVSKSSSSKPGIYVIFMARTMVYIYIFDRWIPSGNE